TTHNFVRRVSAEDGYHRDRASGAIAKAAAATNFPYYGPRPHQHGYHRHPGHAERAQKRQKRGFVEQHAHEYAQHPNRHAISHPLHTIPNVVEESVPPQIRRIPIEFEPPTREEYWKRRCLRMQNYYWESRHRICEQKEDQRQLRRRIQELEKQLLLQSSCGGLSPDLSIENDAKEEEQDAGEDLNESREIEEDDLRGLDTGRQGEEREDRVPNKSSNAKSDRSPNTRLPPTMLAIPKKMAAAACFYLTDGEGLSDSELLDDEEEEDDAVMDERE
ncbi:MAG: hypothetical protein SGARI_003438, partial [Bacillariaceae sp.]